MSMGVGAANPYFQYMGQIQNLNQQSLQALRNSRESSTDSIIRNAGQNSIKNQSAVVSTLQQRAKIGQAIDISV